MPCRWAVCPKASCLCLVSALPKVQGTMNKPSKEQVQEVSAWISALRREIGHVIVGQESLVERLIVALLANGHVLL